MHSDKEGVYESRWAAKDTQLAGRSVGEQEGMPYTLRAAKRTQRRGEWWRGAGGQPLTLIAGMSNGGGLEDSQAHSEPRRVVEGCRRAAKRTQSQGRVVEGARRAPKRTQSLGGVVEGARRAAKRTQIREEWWRRARRCQPNALRVGRSGGGGKEGSQTHSVAGRSGGGGQESSQTHSEPGGVVEGG